MKAFTVGQHLAMLLEDEVWACSDDATRAAMNFETAALRGNYGPEHGDFRQWVFESVRATFGGDAPVDDEPEPANEPGVEPPIY